MNLSYLLDLIPEDAEALIFDLDGTLADTMPFHIIAWEATGKHFNVPITSQLIEEYAGAPSHVVLQKMNERFGWSVDPEEGRKIKSSKYYEILDARGFVNPILPVFELMKYFHRKMPMSIGTGSNAFSANKVIKLIGADDYIDIVVAADEVVQHKPHPETFLRCAEKMNIPPSKCLVFEDGALGVLAAQNAGMSVILVPDYVFVDGFNLRG